MYVSLTHLRHRGCVCVCVCVSTASKLAAKTDEMDVSRFSTDERLSEDLCPQGENATTWSATNHLPETPASATRRYRHFPSPWTTLVLFSNDYFVYFADIDSVSVLKSTLALRRLMLEDSDLGMRWKSRREFSLVRRASAWTACVFEELDVLLMSVPADLEMINL